MDIGAWITKERGAGKGRIVGGLREGEGELGLWSHIYYSHQSRSRRDKRSVSRLHEEIKIETYTY
jgi:hypothetical protein